MISRLTAKDFGDPSWHCSQWNRGQVHNAANSDVKTQLHQVARANADSNQNVIGSQLPEASKLKCNNGLINNAISCRLLAPLSLCLFVVYSFSV